MNLQKDSIVTLNLNVNASNTFFVDSDEGDTLLLTHPLMEGVLVRIKKDEVNKVSANIKDSTERCVDYANNNRQFLDYNTIADLDAVGIYFALKRKLTPRQKQMLANICGVLASVKLDNDVKEAMSMVIKNASILDDFNAMWYNNFKGLFNGRQPITSKKQRIAIFNIAGYVLAELENPTTNARK